VYDTANISENVSDESNSQSRFVYIARLSLDQVYKTGKTMHSLRVVEMEDHEDVAAFVDSIRRKNSRKFDEIEEMRKALDRLNKPEPENRGFQISWTSNW
jgi:hypothetical protein